MGQTSIPVSKRVRDRHAECKPDEISWSEYLDRLVPDVEEVEPDSELAELKAEVARLREQIEKNPGRTADELEGRFR